MVNGDGCAAEFFRKCTAQIDDLFWIVVRDKNKAKRWTQDEPLRTKCERNDKCIVTSCVSSLLLSGYK